MVTDTLFDTSILVDHLRGDERATQLLFDAATAGRIVCSVLTLVELGAGLRDHQVAGIEALRRVVQPLAVDLAVAERAAGYAREWGRSHGSIDPVDHVIAATADVHGATLVTRNTKHFPMFEDLRAPY